MLKAFCCGKCEPLLDGYEQNEAQEIYDRPSRYYRLASGGVEVTLAERIFSMKIKTFVDFEKYRQNKLNIKNLSCNQRIQADAEIMLTKHFFDYENNVNIGMSIDTDVKVNPSSKKDVDIRLLRNGLEINIEVKTPEQDVIENRKLQGGLPHRYPDTIRAEENSDIKNIAQQIKLYSGMETQIQKTNDNKTKDYINGANAKFDIRNSNRVNALAIMGTSKQMGETLLHLMNPHTGLITSTPYDKTIDFSKTDYIILSNAVEGIVSGEKYDFEVNAFSNYVTLIFSPHKSLETDSNVIKFLLSVF
jgi:hypothetical protein